MSKPLVLITGGAGYIGSHVMLALRDRDWPVAVLDDFSTGRRELLPDGIPVYEGSIADPKLLRKIFEAEEIAAIVHFAGSIVVPESIEKPLTYYGNNTVATHSLVSSAVASGIRHLLFSSTAAVYGVPQRVPVDEMDPKQPINPYGASKLMTERMLDDSSAAYQLNYGALRYFNVSGADPELRAGQMGKGSTHLIKVAVEAAVGKRNHVEIFGTDYPTSDGTCIRDYIHVSDLADAHVLALERLIERPEENFTLNCGYGRGHSVLEVLDAVERISNRQIRREMKGRRAGDPPELVASNRRLLETLGWSPRFADIDSIVTHALEWERKLQNGPVSG
jgi:UDP-glucose 4-epimerase